MKYIFSNILHHSCSLRFVRVTEGFLISKQDAATGCYHRFNILPGSSVKFVAFRLSKSTLHFAVSCPDKAGEKQREHLNHSQMQMTALVNRSSCSMLIWETISTLLLFTFLCYLGPTIRFIKAPLCIHMKNGRECCSVSCGSWFVIIFPRACTILTHLTLEEKSWNFTHKHECIGKIFRRDWISSVFIR